MKEHTEVTTHDCMVYMLKEGHISLSEYFEWIKCGESMDGVKSLYFKHLLGFFHSKGEEERK